ncbi:HNH endonuclease [Dermatobacter hominis]|uniref:HNH endonuclease n=1 Tax=Dermatobacter hominis TaxID=2884263 RepID=UPI001D10EAE5|nr:HNH endonuclease [Dermatobacter hominis]
MTRDPRGTAAWKRIRRSVQASVRASGATCHRCGAFIRPDEPIDVDHLVPVAVDPSRALDPTNVAPCHRRCNRAAGAQMTNAKRTKVPWSAGVCVETGEEITLRWSTRWLGEPGGCLREHSKECPDHCPVRPEVCRLDGVLWVPPSWR